VAACGRVQAFDLAEFKSPTAPEVDSKALAAAFAARGWKAQERTVDMALLASAQALEQAGWLTPGVLPEPRPIASIFGTANGPTMATMESMQAFFEKGPRGCGPPRCRA